MTKRERVTAALSFIETDFCPHQVDFTEQAKARCNRFLGIDNYPETIDNHIISCYYDGFIKQTEREGYFIDDFGVIWNRTGADKDIGVIENLQLKDYSDLDTYVFPALDEERLKKEYELMIKNSGDKFRFGSIGFSMFERAWTLRGMENLLMDMIIEPDWVCELLDRILEYNLKIIDIALSFDIDGMFFGDDWGQQKGLIMGPKMWRKFIKPRMAKMYERARIKGKFVGQHSCGDISEVLEDCVEIGLNVYQTVQPEIYDLAYLKQKFGGKLAFWGGISTQRDLAFKTPEEIRKITKDTIALMKKGGGYIAAPTHALEFDVPVENIFAMVDVFKNQ